MPGEYAAHEGGSARSSPCSRGGSRRPSSSTGSSASSASGNPGTSSARCRSHSGRSSRSGSARPRRRASCGSSRTTTTRSRPWRRTSAWRSAAASNRISGARGLQGIAADPPPPRAIVVGHRWDAACTELRHFLDRNQVTFTWVQPEEPDAEESWGNALRGRPPRDPPPRRHDARAAAAAARGRAPRPRHGARRDGLRHDRHRGRARGSGGGRVRRIGGAPDDRDRTGGAGRPGRVVVPDRELPRLPVRGVRRRAGEPRAPAGTAARRGDPRDPDDHGSSPRRRRFASTAATSCGAGRSSSRAAWSGGT